MFYTSNVKFVGEEEEQVPNPNISKVPSSFIIPCYMSFFISFPFSILPSGNGDYTNDYNKRSILTVCFIFNFFLILIPFEGHD